MRLPLARHAGNNIPDWSCAEYWFRWRGNYCDKDMPRYGLNIVIFDTIRYIMPSLLRKLCYAWKHELRCDDNYTLACFANSICVWVSVKTKKLLLQNWYNLTGIRVTVPPESNYILVTSDLELRPCELKLMAACRFGLPIAHSLISMFLYLQ